MTQIAFSRTDDRLGRFDVRHVDPGRDAELLYRWLTHRKSAFWMMQEATVADVETHFTEIARSPHHHAYLGLHVGRPSFLVERYDPIHDEIGEFYPVLTGDVGMHFLVAPTQRPLRGFTRAVIITVMELLFSDPGVRRVVVEPDVRNEPVHTLNAEVGFRVQDVLPLRDKQALLSFCTREQYQAARQEPASAGR